MFYNFSTVELQSHAAEPVYQSAGVIKKIINLIPRAFSAILHERRALRTRLENNDKYFDQRLVS